MLAKLCHLIPNFSSDLLKDGSHGGIDVVSSGDVPPGASAMSILENDGNGHPLVNVGI